MSKYTGQTFTLRTLRDIANLPTDDMVERCMKELSALIRIQRNTVALMNAAADEEAKKDGKEPVSDKVKWQFPEEFTWCDDNGGESEIKFEMAGKELLTVAVNHRKQRQRKAGK